MLFHRLPVAFAFLVLACQIGIADEKPTPEQLNFFETKIRPVLVKECYSCHSDEGGNVRGGLRLDTQSFTLIGGSSGPAVVPGELNDSLLWSAINHEDMAMPPKKKLSDQQIADLGRWIEMGAPDPRVSEVVEYRSSISEHDIETAKQDFWAYRHPAPSTPPSVKQTAWPKTDIDRFIASKLESANLPLATDATPNLILRRLSFDLTGLPPTPQQIDTFARLFASDPDRAIAAFVDSQLANEAFGQRWGRHWLDVARYGESTGGQVNMTFPHAWRYRDYVIESFNDDKPYDQFIQEQIAGDLLPAESDAQWAQNLVATTFLAIGSKNLNEQNRIQFAADVADEQIDATTRVFLGTSVACARCHDHKFDPIPQSDYYAMAGIFQGMKTYFGNPPSEFGSFNTVQANQNSSLLVLPVDDPNPFDRGYTASELADLRQQITSKIDEARQTRSNPNQNQAARIRINNVIADLSAKLAVVDQNGQPLSYCMGVQESPKPSNAKLLTRGEIDLPGRAIPRGIPSVLTASPVKIDDDSSGRLEMARWIGSDQNPLAARVMVNRIWQHLIGTGLVTSTENFGTTGSPPSHPELLDFLAIEFVKSGWSVKKLVRQITTSRVYRIASTFDQDSFDSDPDNTLLWRANQRRLDSEAIRDAILAASGQIDMDPPRGSEVAKAGYLRVRGGILGDPRELMQQQMVGMSRRSGFGRGRQPASSAYERLSQQLDMNDATFRSVYLPVVRDELPRSMEVFDFADPSAVIGTREESNTANQSLFMMNNPIVISQSDAMAQRIASFVKRPTGQVKAAFVLALGRPPTDAERSATLAYMKSVESEQGSAMQPLASVCQSLFASAEFRYLD
ncbi:PSD1 and planctomycete cytochrome C domain-containing protein [Rubripirellula reticaptiva]|uniref:Planctomycete cytochrome C n=1 Tax=Rubripirellula reticaptiva TaxID=2528013 RepID=A0A5C6F7F0_9BACT|nr:PSD1 and planctomycete cytochrome C domain-containing protein [Rubripirellula reticaptiva]TWU56036.1 Planctomycete cytochrome C [Rubripirellula reticaptiva]